MNGAFTFVIKDAISRPNGEHSLIFEVRDSKEMSAEAVVIGLLDHIEKIFGEFDGTIMAVFNRTCERWIAIWTYQSIAGR
ncbi:hypothetical protein H1164_03885 [Thermoactinomyces daqus]|uniref:Uncharacterized protein n=1 Tax=Thermoactinomyces daqus TaxID=1329516 RepID=A0A7W1X8I5_9BACL|nr:hypothetical protein [Thermoactinomyces daqus]MBA4542042.1 hypothetical protein [Thermoactinomyces daqus]